MPRRTDARIPGPNGRWAVGNTHDYDQDRIGFLKNCQAEYGDLFRFSSSTVYLSDPKLINELFRESNDAVLLEDALFASKRDQRRLVDSIDSWMRARNLLRRGMTTPVVRSHGRRVVATFDRTLRSLIGHEFDVLSVMRHYATCSVADFCLGPGSDEIAEAAQQHSLHIAAFMDSSLSIPRWLPLPSVRRAIRAEERAKALVAARVHQRRTHPREQIEDPLDAVLAARDSGLTDDEIVRLLSATMLASAGSPGTALAWLVVELARQPEAQNVLRQEASAAIARTGGLEDDSLLPHSQAFVKEVLRLYPPTWLMGRTVRRQFVLGDWTLAAGTRVMFSPYLVHRDRRWWTDPDVFRPERWTSPSETMVPHTFIPFGAGPRVCFGMHLGMYQLVTCAAQLAANYTVELTAMEESDASPGALLEPRSARARVVPAPTTAAVRVSTTENPTQLTR